MRACDICGREVQTFKRDCDGDGSMHRHGMVHTSLRGSTNDLAAVGVECGCAAADAATWRAWSGPRDRGTWPGRVEG